MLAARWNALLCWCDWYVAAHSSPLEIVVSCLYNIGMYHSGIGGGGFALLRGPNGIYESIDFRESAPAAAYEEMYTGNTNGSVFGGLSW